MLRRLATYQPSAYLLVDHRPPTLNNMLSAIISLANLIPAGDCFDVYFAELILL